MHPCSGKIHTVAIPPTAEQGEDVPKGQADTLLLQEGSHPQASERDRDSQTLKGP